eukprot:SAG22_NODE_21634_length_255_cov_0.903846_1_plen_43_part_01
MWCQQNVVGVKFSGGELAPPATVDSWDDCVDECAGNPGCAWID